MGLARHAYRLLDHGEAEGPEHRAYHPPEGAEAEEKERRAAGRRRDRRDMSDGWRPWERAGRGDGAPDRGG